MPEYTTIVLHIAADRAAEFEAMFEREELPRWDDFTARGRFLEARLVRCAYSDLMGGYAKGKAIQDYVLHVVTADHEAHLEHDADPGFKDYNRRADEFQPHEPTVTFGEVVFERWAPRPSG